MICAEDEIGIGHDHAGIIVLPSDARVGMPAAEYYHITTDYTIEIDITPNRVDGASHLGVARDFSCLFTAKRPGDSLYPSFRSSLCSRQRYCRNLDRSAASGSVVPDMPEYVSKELEVQESPEWLQTRLKAIGLHPINDVVDISEFHSFRAGTSPALFG